MAAVTQGDTVLFWMRECTGDWGSPQDVRLDVQTLC